MIRENEHLRREADQREQQIQQHLGKISSAPPMPSIVISQHGQSKTKIIQDNLLIEDLQLPELSSIHSRPSDSQSGEYNNVSERLMMHRNKALIRELRKEVAAARKKYRRTTRELVRKDW